MSNSSKDEITRQILSVTETLIAEIGIHNLSMRKIATKADLALGTLYLHFKTKEDLLTKLAYDLYDRFHYYVEKDYCEQDSFFERYRRMFENKLQFLRDHPTVAANLSQYQAMPGFDDVIRKAIHDKNSVWSRFVLEGQAKGVIAKLPTELLNVLGIGTVIDIVYFNQITQTEYPKEVIDEVLLRSWKAITA